MSVALSVCLREMSRKSDIKKGKGTTMFPCPLWLLVDVGRFLPCVGGVCLQGRCGIVYSTPSSVSSFLTLSSMESFDVSSDKAGCSGASKGAEIPVKFWISPRRARA